jgi:hypothetical protein
MHRPVGILPGTGPRISAIRFVRRKSSTTGCRFCLQRSVRSYTGCGNSHVPLRGNSVHPRSGHLWLDGRQDWAIDRRRLRGHSLSTLCRSLLTGASYSSGRESGRVVGQDRGSSDNYLVSGHCLNRKVDGPVYSRGITDAAVFALYSGYRRCGDLSVGYCRRGPVDGWGRAGQFAFGLQRISWEHGRSDRKGNMP